MTSATASDVTARTELIWSDEWTIEADEDRLILTAGRDVRVEVDGSDTHTTGIVRSWSEGTPIDPGLAPVLTDHLLTLGAVTVRRRARPAVVLTDGTGTEFSSLLAAGLRRNGIDVGPVGDLALVLLPEGQPPAQQTHLAVDVGNHHTLVLGPLVIPGITACVTCLQTRRVRRWPAVAAPQRPAMRRYPEVVAELIAIQVGLFVRGKSPLINATIAWDLERGVTDRAVLLKVPGCPVCDQAELTGRITLPWKR